MKKERHIDFIKDSSHYISRKPIEGSREEVEMKLEAWEKRQTSLQKAPTKGDVKTMRKQIQNTINRPRYIVWDAETDTHTGTHKPNLIVVNVLQVAPSHEYSDSLLQEIIFEGYTCCDDFCKWLFSKENANSTVIAHNGSGYDYKFVLKWCLERALKPSTYICQGSHITKMTFKHNNLNFIDSLNFFISPLAALSKTYDIDTVKGYFPHCFNRPENQHYVGPIPSEEEFGARNMGVKQYDHFKKWHDKCVQEGLLWDFHFEFIKYCQADVVLLAKAVLKYRKMFKDLEDADPWRYSTVAALSMGIYMGRHMPEKTIVGNSGIARSMSMISKEWLLYSARTDQHVYKHEVPIYLVKSDVPLTAINDRKDITEDDDSKPIYFKHSNKARFTTDAYCSDTKTVKEFYGCFWHGCRKCHPELKDRYNKTMERENLLKNLGCTVCSMWECQWDAMKEDIPDRKELEEAARHTTINIRDALYGGRTEGVKSYYRCKGRERIFAFDICSLYPTVNALDVYAVGFKRFMSIIPDDILSGKFFGVAKVDVVPPKNLYIPLLPDRTNGKLLFHLNPMYAKTYSSVELRRALELGYKITKIHAAAEYEQFTGLMKEYVEKFVRVKIQCSGVLNDDQCKSINDTHAAMGLNINIVASETQDNPGKRQVANILLNSLWGKFGQRPNIKQCKFLNKYNDFVRNMTDATIVPMSWDIIGENMLEFAYAEDTENMLEP
jgi:G:T-mismatch repair DNA endonuclease (very short patch repair protein)